MLSLARSLAGYRTEQYCTGACLNMGSPDAGMNTAGWDAVKGQVGGRHTTDLHGLQCYRVPSELMCAMNCGVCIAPDSVQSETAVCAMGCSALHGATQATSQSPTPCSPPCTLGRECPQLPCPSVLTAVPMA